MVLYVKSFARSVVCRPRSRGGGTRVGASARKNMHELSFPHLSFSVRANIPGRFGSPKSKCRYDCGGPNKRAGDRPFPTQN